MKKFLSKQEYDALSLEEDKMMGEGLECYVSAVSLEHYYMDENDLVYCKGARVMFTSEEDYKEFVTNYKNGRWKN